MSGGIVCRNVWAWNMEHCSVCPFIRRQAGWQAAVRKCGGWLAANWVTAHPSNVSSHDVTPTNHYSPAAINVSLTLSSLFVNCSRAKKTISTWRSCAKMHIYFTIYLSTFENILKFCYNLSGIWHIPRNVWNFVMWSRDQNLTTSTVLNGVIRRQGGVIDKWLHCTLALALLFNATTMVTLSGTAVTKMSSPGMTIVFRSLKG